MKAIYFFLSLLFTTLNTTAQTYNVDPTFNTGNVGVSGGVINCMIKQPDGKIIIGGTFTAYNGVNNKCVARLNSDGTLDNSFNVGNGPTTTAGFVTIKALAMDSEGKILIAGFFTSFNGSSRNCIVRLNANGSVDATFNGSNFINDTSFLTRKIECLKIDQNGRILVGGQFRVNGQTPSVVYGLIRLNLNGAFDSTFAPNIIDLNNDSRVTDIDFQSDNKIVVAVSNFFNRPILRFNSNGTTDTTFLTTPYQGFATKLLVMPDDKILLGAGVMQTVSGGSFRTLVKLNADGSLDPTFTIYIAESGSSTVNSNNAIDLQGDKILIGGNMTTYGAVANNGITRLNSNGTPDSTFIIGTGANSTILGIDIDENEKILLWGYQSSFNGIPSKFITRLTDAVLATDNMLSLNKISFINNGLDYSFHSTSYTISGFVIYDITGKILQEIHNVNTSEYVISNDFPTGIKFIKVKMTNGMSEIIKTVD